MNPQTKFTTIDEYLAVVAPDVRPILETLRTVIQHAVPDAEETISYQMPAFRRKHLFIFFAAFQKHIGLYPPLHPDDPLVQELLPYRGEKGNLKFPLHQPIPYALIARIAEALARQADRSPASPTTR